MKVVLVLFTVALLGVVSTAAKAKEQAYVVQPNDRLHQIAERFGVTPEEIRTANPHAIRYTCKPGNERQITLRSGEIRSLCLRPLWWLITGKTIIIPTPRTVLEVENIRLYYEVSALGAERDRMQQELNALRAERDRLAKERDVLQAANAKLMVEKAELLGQSNALRAVLAEKTKQTEAARVNYYHVLLAVLGTALLSVIGLFIILRYKGRNEREFDRLVKHLQPRITQQAEENEKRRRELDRQVEDLVLSQREIEADQAALRSQRDHFAHWEKDLERRQAAADERDRKLADERQSLSDRETACVVREAAVERRLVAVTDREETFAFRVKEQSTQLDEKAASLETFRQSLNEQKRDQDRRDVDQELREQMLVQGFNDLTAARERLQEEQDALERQRAQVEAGLQRLSEDGAKIEQRAAEVTEREAVLQELEAAAERKNALADVRLKELEEAQESLGIEQRELECRQRELAERVAEAQHIINTAGGLETAQNILRRAKRKEVIVVDLDAREAALNKREAQLNQREADLRMCETALKTREQACADREANLETWALRLGDLQQGLASSEPVQVGAQPSDVDPSAITHLEPPAVAISQCICGECGQEFPLGADDEHEKTCLGQPDKQERREFALVGLPESKLSRKTTLPPPFPPPPTNGAGDDFSDDSLDETHRILPSPAGATRDTGPQIPIIAEPLPHAESSFFCSACQRDIPMDKYDEHLAAHRKQNNSGSLSES